MVRIGFPSTSLAVPGALGPFPAARLYADNLAYPTTTDVLSWTMLDDGTTGDKQRAASPLGAALTVGVAAGAAMLYDSPGVQHIQLRSARSLAAGDAGSSIAPALGWRYNGASFDPETNNRDATLLASAARTASTTTPTQTNYDKSGVWLVLNITATPGGAETLSVYVQIPSVTGGTPDTTIVRFPSPAAGTTGAFRYLLYSGAVETIATTGVEVQGLALPRNWNVLVEHSSTGIWTYSLMAQYCT